MDINEKLNGLEKEYQCVYCVNKRLHIRYINEDAQKALEFLATSKGKLKERIWFAYQYYLINFLWSFDYKNHLSEENQRNWEFLQRELNYRFSNTKRQELQNQLLKKCSKDIIYGTIEKDRYKNTFEIGAPSFLHNIRTKDLKIAKAMFCVIDEIADLSRKSYTRR